MSHRGTRETLVVAVETSVAPGSVALLDGSGVVREFPLDAGRPTAGSLFVTLREALGALEKSPSDATLLAVGTGPGSFTGLRIGITFAKTWCYALRTPLVGMTSLEIIAAQVPPSSHRLWVALDAQRGQLFVQPFGRQEDHWSPLAECQMVARDTWWASRSASDLVTGPGLEGLPHQRTPPEGPQVADRATWIPRAASLARLARARQRNGQLDDPWLLAPKYVRKSAAEEKAELADQLQEDGERG